MNNAAYGLGGDKLWVLFQKQQEHMKQMQQQILDLTNALSRSARRCENIQCSSRDKSPVRNACTSTETTPRQRHVQTSCQSLSFPSSPPRRYGEKLETHTNVKSSTIGSPFTRLDNQPVISSFNAQLKTCSEAAGSLINELQNAPDERNSVRAAIGDRFPPKLDCVRRENDRFAFESTAPVPSSPSSDAPMSDVPAMTLPTLTVTSVVPPSVTGALRLRNLAAQAANPLAGSLMSHLSPSKNGRNGVPQIRYQASSPGYSDTLDFSDIVSDTDRSEDERIKTITRKYAVQY